MTTIWVDADPDDLRYGSAAGSMPDVFSRRVRPGRVYVESCICRRYGQQQATVSIGGTITNHCCDGRGWVYIRYCPACGDTEQYGHDWRNDDDGAVWMSCLGCDASWRADDRRWLAQALPQVTDERLSR
jgi:hypothetical protein